MTAHNMDTHYEIFGKADADGVVQARELVRWKRLAQCSMVIAALAIAVCASALATSAPGTPGQALLMHPQMQSPPSVLQLQEQQEQQEQCVAAPPAHKMVLDGVTPIQLQLSRGTCWMFAAVAMLEHSYRQQGVARGWLKPSQYLKLSEQAFGIAVLDACRAQPDACLFDDDEIHTGTSTQGGEFTVLYSLRSLSNTSALPWSVCPYTPQPGRDRECAGLRAAQQASPLRFHVRGVATHYERLAMKAALRRGRMLALSMPLANVLHLLPCTAATRDALSCDPGEAGGRCHACPSQRAYAGVDCCILSEREMNTMAGEFYYSPILPLRKEGGHAVAVVGYNDLFLTEAGFRGGWVIKNSWWDGTPPLPSWKHARGSHTLGYFLQRHSDADERSVCPNVHSPRSWYACDDLYTCRKPLTARYAQSIHKVLRLECTDASPFAKGVCKRGSRYFLRRIAPWGDEPGDLGGGLSTACLIEDDPDVVATASDPSGGVTRRRRLAAAAEEEKQGGDAGGGSGRGEVEGAVAHDPAAAAAPSMEDKEDHAMAETGADAATGGDGGAREICTPPLPLDDLALIFQPIAAEVVENDRDQCGYYLMPYAILETLSVRFGGMFATELDVEWDATSYAANAAAAAHAAPFDWSLVERDTREQASTHFGGGPYPDTQTPTRR